MSVKATAVEIADRQRTLHRLYDVWNVGRICLPSRSSLYPLVPMGVGTPLVESLASYISRLAIAHGVLVITMLTHILRPAGPVETAGMTDVRGTSGLNDDDNHTHSTDSHLRMRTSLASLNGVDDWTQMLVQRLESCVCRTGLQCLTFLPWADVISHSQLCRPTRAWCPTCYAEWSRQGRTLYDPLLWSAKVVRVCPIHQCELAYACPSCRRSQSLFKRQSTLDVCMYCGATLAAQTPNSKSNEQQPLQSKSKHSLRWNVWVANNVSGWLGAGQALESRAASTDFQQALRRCLAATGRTTTELARMLQTHHPIIAIWLRSFAKPTLAMILRIAYCFDVSLHDLLLGTIKMQRITLRQLPAQARLPITAQQEDPERIGQALLKFLGDPSEPPLSMHQVAMRLGHAETFFLKRHPKLYCAIRDRYATYVREHKIWI